MKRIISLLMTVFFVFQFEFAVISVSAADTVSPETALRGIVKWENTSLDDISDHAGEGVYDWFAFSCGRLGENMDDGYVSAAEEYFRENKDTLTTSDIERISLSCASNGCDISKNGMLDSALEGFSTDLSGKMINQLIFTLHVLDSGFYSIPEGCPVTRSALIDEILSRQLDSGALYMMNKNTPETDITAMAVSALAPYTSCSETIKISVDKMIEYLSTQLDENCTVKNWGTPSCESTAQVIVALCSVGIDPKTDERFIKNGKTLLDGLLTYRQSDLAFSHNSESTGSDAYASAQAFYSLIAYIRFEKGYRPLFDMRSETSDTPSRIEFFSPDEIADDRGTSVSPDILAQNGLAPQSLTVAAENVTTIDLPINSDTKTPRKQGTPKEFIILILIAAAAFIAIILNHTLFKNRKDRT